MFLRNLNKQLLELKIQNKLMRKPRKVKKNWLILRKNLKNLKPTQKLLKKHQEMKMVQIL